MKERKDLHWQGPYLYAGTRRAAAIVQDKTYPGMWRVRQPDGSLSDMVNLTPARDAAMAMVLRNLEGGISPSRAIYSASDASPVPA